MAVSAAVAGGAAELEFVGGGVVGLLVGRVVVVFEEVGGATIDTGPVAFSDHSFLSFPGNFRRCRH